jgi:hypothetical protein
MGWFKGLFGSGGPSPEQRTQADHADPRKRYVFGLMSLLYDADPAYQKKVVSVSLKDWYGIDSRDELLERIQDYLAANDSPAYDAFRAAFLARVGFGAGLLTEDESWAWGVRAAQKVQATYRNWGEYGMGFLAGHLDYWKDCGKDADYLQDRRQHVMTQIQARSSGLWANTPFTLAL